ncbi:MAG: SPASM domain-containing protein [Helicobacter sp.]|nr:SPASM domain-containing protein [Helicobacter sp.]
MHSFNEQKIKSDFFEDRRLYNLSQDWEVIGLNTQNKKESLELKYPKCIYIGLLNQCNISCPHCAWFSQVHKETQTNDYFNDLKRLPKNKVSEILDYAKEANCKIIFSGPGEPLLESNLIDFVQEAKHKGIKNIEIATNGVLLNEKIFNDLLVSGVTCLTTKICFTKFAEEIYSQFGNNFIEDFKKTLKKYCIFLSKNSSGVKIELIISYDREYFKEAFYFFTDIQEWANESCKIELAYYPSNIKWWESSKLNNLRHTCSAPFSNLYIFPDGSVGVCMRCQLLLGREEVENLRIGNIYSQNLNEIWQGEIHKKWTSWHIDSYFDELKPCLNCACWWNELE